MGRIISAILSCVVILVLSTFAFSQDSQTQAMETFKKIVSNYKSFLKQPQKVLYKQEYSDSKSGYLYTIEEYSCSSISYDIQKTESLISPYLGIIDLDLISKGNESCGDVEGYKGNIGWSNSSDAIKHSNDSTCFHYFQDNPKIDPVRLYFAYQDSKWVFKKAIRTNYDRPELCISATYGVEIEVGRKVETKKEMEFNKKWVEIIKLGTNLQSPRQNKR